MTMAAQLQAVVIGWMLYQVTRDPLALGLIGLAEVVPYVGVALVAGYITDRANRRSIAVLSLGVLLVAALGLFAFSLLAPAPTIVWPFYGIIAVCGVARSFLQVSRSALVSEIVPKELYTNAATWRSSTWQLGTVVGPALGGALYAAAGARVTFGLNVLLSAVSFAAMVLVIHVPAPRGAAPGNVSEDLRAGLAFLLRNRVILAALTLDMVAVLFGGAIALLPIFASDILAVGPRGLGILQAATGAGAVTMAIIVAHRPPFQRAGRALLWSVTIFGVCIVGFGLSKNFLLSIALLFVSGAADNVSAVIRSTMIQVLVPQAMLGRISAVNAIFIGSSNELGAFESGVAARLFGAVPAVVAGGIIALGAVAITTWKVPILGAMGEIRREASVG